MPSRMKRRFLVTAVSVLASVSLASAQGLQANQSIGQSQSSPTDAQTSTKDHGQAGAAVDLSRDDIRVVQRVLIERGFLHGKADGVLGPKTRKAISSFQRQQGIEMTGSIDARTVSSLGVAGRLSRQANQSIGQSQSSPTGAQTSTKDHGQAGAAVDLSRNDIRVVQRVLIERGFLHGKADGVLGPKTRKAISSFQRQQGIEMTGSIDARTVSSLGVAGRLSRQANQSIGQSQASPTGAQTSTKGHGQAGTGQAQAGPPQPSQESTTGQAPNQTTGQAPKPPAQQSQQSTTGHGQAGTGQAQAGPPQPSQQNATGQVHNQTTGQAPNPTAQQSQRPSTTGQSTLPNQSNTTTGQAAPSTQSGNEPTANENAPSGGFSLTFSEAAIGFLVLALGAFILVPAV